MKRRGSFLALTLVLALFPLALAYANGTFALPWWSADGGGGLSTGGGFSLQGVIGQPDAGLMQGGDFSLAGGFLGGAGAQAPVGHDLFLPVVVR